MAFRIEPPPMRGGWLVATIAGAVLGGVVGFSCAPRNAELIESLGHAFVGIWGGALVTWFVGPAVMVLGMLVLLLLGLLWRGVVRLARSCRRSALALIRSVRRFSRNLEEATRP